MIYSREQLIQQIQQGYQPEYLFFWGHQARKDGTIGYSCFSQWWMSDFKDDQHKYSSAEQYMMAGKARLFCDNEILNQILETKSPQEVKALGRKVNNFDNEVWGKQCYDLVKAGNLMKFNQNADLKDYLLSTGNKVIVEASPYDRIWGIGLKKEHPDAGIPGKWQGQNLLGFVLMEVRDELSKK